jgi:radical SAM protein with 4Fe4S-binding SPASM domain
MIDDLAAFGVPVVLFSGGEPLMREDMPELIAYAARAGIRTVLSTNGTLITAGLAESLAQAGLNYAGISLDGLERTNDRIRGMPRAFRQALAGMDHCRNAGIRVGIRFTMTRQNLADLPRMFELAARKDIPRVCFYHLVPAGRAEALASEALDADRTRAALDLIIDRTAAAYAAGQRPQVLTVDNHADGPYLYMKLLKVDAQRARQCLELLRAQGGNASGRRIGCVSWNGDVHPDQFWRRHVLGNPRRRRFSEIWSDESQPLLAGLRQRRRHLKGRCRRCRWLDVCNGNLRARAEAATGEIWGQDPACYLTEEEIAP